MALPKKSLRECELKPIGNASHASAHEIIKVEFSETGETRVGFYKKLAPNHHYPELLAKISVAVSVLKGISQGTHSAEERLVFNEDHQIVGTLSLEMKGFKPFLFASETPPADAAEKALVIPDTQTLIAANAMATLVARWAGGDDDSHPHNWGLLADGVTGDMDFDMFLRGFIVYMKGGRLGIANPPKKPIHTVRDWEVFPNIKDAKPYHNPTYKHPGQESIRTFVPGAQEAVLSTLLPKAYPNPQAFIQLACEPKAQEQKLMAALKILLTYNPDMIKARLDECFGSMSLNYTSLDKTSTALRALYEKEFPQWCNAQTNVEPFVKFFMGLYQEYYDSLYRVVVYYLGCQNNGYGLSLPATCVSLYEHPSYYQSIEAWVKVQNEERYAKDNALIQYNVDDLRKRYHQVWRDSFAPNIRQLLRDTYKLIQDLSPLSSHFLVVSNFVRKRSFDEDLSDSLLEFDVVTAVNNDELNVSFSVVKDKEFPRVLLPLIDFANQLNQLIESYYSKKCNELHVAVSRSFVKAVDVLINQFAPLLIQSLDDTPHAATECSRILTQLKNLTEVMDFDQHLEQSDDKVNCSKVMMLVKHFSYSDPQVLEKFNQALFSWANSIEKEAFNQIIIGIIDEYYAPTWLISTRCRAVPVKAYLKTSMHEKNDVRLAYILSSGASADGTGALNQSLIAHIAPDIAEIQHISSLRAAINSGVFYQDRAVFARAATQYAKNKFIHLYSVEGKNLFYGTLFAWIKKLSKAQFVGIVKATLNEYEQDFSMFKSSLASFKTFVGGADVSRRKEVEAICAASHDCASAFMQLIAEGNDDSTYNKMLFNKVITLIQADIKAKPALQPDAGYALLAEYNQNEHGVLYLGELKPRVLMQALSKPAKPAIMPGLTF